MAEAMEEIRQARPRRFRPYPKYRDSGVEWLDEIPASWEMKRLKYLAEFSTGWTPPTGRDDLYDGEHLWANISDLGPKVLTTTAKTISDAAVREASLSIVDAGSLLFSFKLSVGTVSIAGVDMYTNEAIAAFAKSSQIDTQFLYWAAPVLVPRNAQENIYGAPLLNRERIANAVLLSPPVQEQRAIASFLDRETAKIDELVAKKERLSELLQEKRTALITRAVTQGLDPNVPMNDSGVEWLGKIPVHWESGSLARWWRVIDCKHRTVAFQDDGIAVASIGEVQGLEVDLSGAKRTSPEEYNEMIEGGRLPEIGDIIYSRNATVGSAALVATKEPFCMGQDVSLIRSATQDQRFLLFQLRSPAVMSQLDAEMVGSTFKRINVGRIKTLAVAVPPVEEQRQISEFASRTHDEVQRLIDRVDDAILCLREFRTALISAAVTGRIDVREESV